MEDIKNNHSIEIYDYSPKQLKILEELFPVCSGKVTKVQWQYFAYVCQNSKLDPFLKQIYPVPFRNNKTQRYDLVPITGIDGFRAIAHNTGKLGGIGDFHYNDDKTLYEMRKENIKLPQTATVEVYKIVDNVMATSKASADWISYYPGANSPKAEFWNKYPYLKLGYCAEKLCLRKAFSELSGIYLEEEMDKSGLEVPSINDSEVVDLINELYQLYEKFSYNEAKRIETNNKLGGSPRAEYIPKERLQEMIKVLKGESNED